MAITKSATIPSGNNLAAMYPEFSYCAKSGPTTVPDAYYKIINVSGGKDIVDITVAILPHKSGGVLSTISLSFVPSVADGAPNFIAQAYQYLKTLPEFADAVDC